MNSTGGSQVLVRDKFASAFVKNFILVMVWLILSYINGSLVTTFFRKQIFNEDPRYILFIHMVINDALLLTLTVTMTLLSYIFYTISVYVCTGFVLVAMITSHNTPLNLAGMAIERYIAVCDPLRHSQICTVRRTYIFIGLIWFFSFVPDITDLFVTLSKEPLSFFYSSVFCLRQNVFKDLVLMYRRDVFDAFYFSIVFLTLIYTYLRVLLAAHAMSTDKSSAHRARNTILLHGAQLLMCMLSYIYPSMEVFLNIIFPGHTLEIRYANYLISFIVPRFLSPIIYGVRDQKFRKYLKRNFVISQCKVMTRVENQVEENKTDV
ncbi:odorant receptor 131-2-like [Salminus brasiliensis]|uniref:odorant receptor 131-2-like n=1 Tax=Salminus brasiliensis TaxID=930266 RepID=UPI003B82DD37